MKTNQVIRIIIPVVLLLGAATALIVAVLGSQQVNTAVNETDEASQVISAFVAYLYVEGVDGEAQEQNHQAWIEVLAYSQNMLTADSADPVRSTGAVKLTPLRITKMIDKASPKLFEMCSTGDSIYSVKLHCCAAFGEVLKPFYQIELKNAIITSVQDFGIVSGEHIPTETVTFTYESIKLIYTEYDAAGQSKGNVETPWISEEIPA